MYHVRVMDDDGTPVLVTQWRDGRAETISLARHIAYNPHLYVLLRGLTPLRVWVVNRTDNVVWRGRERRA